MRTKLKNLSYTQKIIILCFVLLALILLLSLALSRSGPRVRFVEFSEDTSQFSWTKNSNIVLHFDRPIEQQDYSQQITITPKIDFSAQTNVQDISIQPRENFLSNQTYKIEVGPDIYDLAGKTMSKGYSKEFQTTQPKYAYIQRNYGEAEEPNDHIKLAQIGRGEESIFSNPDIVDFDINRNFAVVSTQGESSDYINIVGLADNKIKDKIEPKVAGRINLITTSTLGNTALFTVTPDFNSVDAEDYQIYSNHIEKIDLSSGEVSILIDKNGQPLKAHSILFGLSDQFALIQKPDQTFQAISPFDDFEPITIGSYTAVYSLVENDSKIIFRDQDELLIYDINSSDTKPINLGIKENVAEVNESNDQLFLRSQTFSPLNEVLNEIYKISDYRGSPDKEIVWTNKNDNANLIRETAPSLDGQLIAVNSNPESCEYDSIGANPRCKQTQTKIFKTNDSAEIAEFPGFGLRWIP